MKKQPKFDTVKDMFRAMTEEQQDEWLQINYGHPKAFHITAPTDEEIFSHFNKLSQEEKLAYLNKWTQK